MNGSNYYDDELKFGMFRSYTHEFYFCSQNLKTLSPALFVEMYKGRMRKFP